MTAPTDYKNTMRDHILRPQYHFSPERNWINDPNGLIWFEGEYHLFYQYNPFGDQWGHMSWGHAISNNLADWQELPVAIPEDLRVSIFSGSVVADHHNTSGFGHSGIVPLVAIYTGCLRVATGGQAQELAYSLDKGRTWRQYANNPVLDLNLRDFRDPKVFWHEPTHCWIMIVVLPNEQIAQFYRSLDLKVWMLLSQFCAPVIGHGIWECPDLIQVPLETSDSILGASVWMLKVDVLAGHPSKGSGARIFFGHFDGKKFTANPSDDVIWADHGADFYAALSWSDLPSTQNKPIWLAWMSCHRYAKHIPTPGWRGSMSLPRQLSVRKTENGLQLVQNVIKPIANLTTPAIEIASTSISDLDTNTIGANKPSSKILIDTRSCLIECSISDSTANACGVVIKTGHQQYTSIGFDYARASVFVDRSSSGFLPPDDSVYPERRYAPCPKPSATKPLSIQIWLDRASVEIFANDGLVCLTEQIFPIGQADQNPAPSTSCQIAYFSTGGVTQFDAGKIWPILATGQARQT